MIINLLNILKNDYPPAVKPAGSRFKFKPKSKLMYFIDRVKIVWSLIKKLETLELSRVSTNMAGAEGLEFAAHRKTGINGHKACSEIPCVFNGFDQFGIIE